MNKKLQTLRVVLILLIIFSAASAIYFGMKLWQEIQIERYIASPSSSEDVPDDPRAHFAKATDFEKQEKHELALDQLTIALGNAPKEVMTLAYYNRGNINLRSALDMTQADARQLPLIELAKQDFRSALALDPDMWDARYNLEVALRTVPEDPDVNPDFEKNIISSQRSIESKAFKVDLP
ncbi:MxaK protein [Methylophaga sulfidovorans]|uniref:MxaK protein n=1 Tax=Methylophaga sulfidovorans TaxID=45496 RepID=A0A1I3VKL5_9GAMM|nr:MxaK protein [Methylophaga sulfidovorans]SFJ95533.1 mxaK protein [Methylophaga sulfidovorans]